MNNTWHHLDNLEIINGETYCTMQLVNRNAHNAALGISGMSHSASVAQYKTYYINSSDRLLYTD